MNDEFDKITMTLLKFQSMHLIQEFKQTKCVLVLYPHPKLDILSGFVLIFGKWIWRGEFIDKIHTK